MTTARVASPPARPLMIYDGDCNFCKFWIVRWRELTGGRVEYVESQDPRVAEQFPELPRERFETSVQLIEPDGRVYSGAEAVFRALGRGAPGRLAPWFYYRVAGMRPVTEWCYAFIAGHREFFSTLTRWFWGRQAGKPDYFLVRGIFLRLLGIIYFSAFVSLGTQISGLSGSNGILPAQELMESARMYVRQNDLGLERYHLLPTLCWFNTSDGFLHFLCGAGAVISLVVVVGFAPASGLFLLWLIYLSLVVVGREFLSFQWDSLLLETGWLAIFLAPLEILPGRGARSPPSRLVVWLLRWLLFRLMFESGAVKLLSHDASWSGLTALNFHYETQPLPTWIGWYAHQLPAGIQQFSVRVMFVIELAVPFLIFAPRRLRFFGCWWLVLFQALILLTGNYCFFNLLTIALCWLLLDDAAARAILEKIRWCGRLIRRCIS
ncbi:MAG TPA: lipase maturation factor family protein, partial [Verrucomicrobiae bacterium]|nr:lipase maturation factor family protein [Verrucomicrobiae bacterium]